MKVSTVSFASQNQATAYSRKLPQKVSSRNEAPLKVADVLPATGILGGALMVAYLTRGGTILPTLKQPLSLMQQISKHVKI